MDFKVALERVIENSASRISMGEAARRRAEPLFPWDRKARKVIKVYLWVLNQRSSKPEFDDSELENEFPAGRKAASKVPEANTGAPASIPSVSVLQTQHRAGQQITRSRNNNTRNWAKPLYTISRRGLPVLRERKYSAHPRNIGNVERTQQRAQRLASAHCIRQRLLR